MGYIPHPEIPLGSLRTHDMLLLLVAGAVWELLVRSALLLQKRKPSSVRRREVKLKLLEMDIKKSRDKGPQFFVETSKLERKQLAEEKSLTELAEKRKERLEVWQRLTRNANLILCAVILFVYYGVPMLEFSAENITPPMEGEVLTVEQAGELAQGAMQAFLFPLSAVGVGVRISKWGLANPKASVGALLVFWSSQTTVSKIMDGVDALLMY